MHLLNDLCHISFVNLYRGHVKFHHGSFELSFIPFYVRARY